jgi:iron(III) transport system substrate-binding protein
LGLSAAAFLAAFAYSLSAAVAAPRTVDEIALYKGADRQTVLEEGAKKEAVLQVYETGTQMEPVRNEFRKKYPFIRLQVFSSDSSDLVKRTTEEYRAGRYAFDIIRQPTGVLYILKDTGVIRPYYSPEMEKYRPDAMEPSRYWVLDYENYLGLGFNTKEVSVADAPKNLDELLDPKWKGKMGLADGSSSTINNWVGSLILTRGEDYVRKLGQQAFRVFRIDGRALANLVVSGEVAMSPTIYSSHVHNSKRNGASLEWLPMGTSYALIDAVAMASKPPSPHAGMLYADFMLSREAQAMNQEMGYHTARTDMQNSLAKPESYTYLTERPNYPQEFEHWGTVRMQAFGRGQAK